MVKIVGSAPAVNDSVMCFVCNSLSRFRMIDSVITETLLSSVIFKTIMASSHRGRFVVEHLC